MFSFQLLQNYDADMRALFFSVYGDKIFIKNDIWMEESIFLSKHTECPQKLISFHKNSTSLSPKHPFLIELFTDQWLHALILILPFWIIEAFRSLIFAGITRAVLNDYSSIETTTTFFLLEKFKLFETTTSSFSVIEIPTYGKLHIQEDVDQVVLEVFVTKTVLMRHYILYFHKLLKTLLVENKDIPFSVSDEMLFNIYKDFYTNGLILSLDYFFNNLRKNNLSVKNLLTSFLKNAAFFDFFIELFFNGLKRFCAPQEFLVFEVEEVQNTLLKQLGGKKYEQEFFKQSDFKFLLRLKPKVEKKNEGFQLQNFLSQEEQTISYFYGQNVVNDTFFKFFMELIYEEIVRGADYISKMVNKNE